MIALVIVVLCIAVAAIVTDIHTRMFALDGRHAPQARHRTPVAAPEAGPATVPPVGPAGTAAASSLAGKAAAVPLPLAVETRPLYQTGGLQRLGEQDEGRWLP